MDSNQTEENIDIENFQNKENLSNDDQQFNLHKKMLIKSKDSVIHVGPKFVFQMKNKKDIDQTLKPFLEYLNPQINKQLSIDLTDKMDNVISENDKPENDQQSIKNEDGYLEGSIAIEEIELYTNNDSQSSENNKFDNHFKKMKINQDENELLLSPEYFNTLKNPNQVSYSSVSTQSRLHQNCANVNPFLPISSTNADLYANSSTNIILAPSEIQTADSKTFKNENILNYADNQNILNSDNFQRQKLRSECMDPNSVNIQQQSFMYQDLSADFSSQDLNYYSDYIKDKQNSEKTSESSVQSSASIKKCLSQCSSSSDIQDQRYEFKRQAESSHTNSSANIPISYSNSNVKTIANHFPTYVQNKQFPPKLNQLSLSLPNGVCDDLSFQLYNNTNKKIYHNELSRERLLKRPKCEWTPLGVNFMEANNFRLGIIPGKFYNTENGVLVEMQNGKNYTIFLSNDNKEQCDVDIIVDTKIVGKLRLDGNTTEYLEGPRNSSLKFLFLRARDSPPQAEIIYDDEGNGLIEAIFKPEKVNKQKTRIRAWSAESNGPFLQSLHHTFENIFGPKVDELSDSNIINASTSLRSGKFCAGATALQGEQKSRYAELVDDIETDENRTVVLQLRLVARTDDSNQPDIKETIKPLVTKRPPPLPP